MKKSILYLVAPAFFLLSCSQLEKENGGIPTVTTHEATSVTRSTAVLSGETSGGVDNMVSRGVCFSKSELVEFGDPAVSVVRGSGKFSKMTHELDAMTKYYMRAFAVMKDGSIHYGNVLSFTTKDFAPAELGVPTALNVLSKEAQVQAEVVYEGDYHINEYGFIYSATPDVMMDSEGVKKAVAVRKDNLVTATLLDLEIGTVYYVRAYAVTEMGYSYSEEMSFTTDSRIPAELSAVTASEITLTSLKVSAEITAANGTVSEKGFCWSVENSIPNMDDSYVTIADDNLVYTIEGLKAASRIYIRAYAVNDAGINYSEVLVARLLGYPGEMVTVNPPEEFCIGWLGDLQGADSSKPSIYAGANDGSFENLTTNMNKYYTYKSYRVQELAPYRVCKYEVTNKEYADFLNAYGSDTVKEGNRYAGRKLYFDDVFSLGTKGDDGKWTVSEENKNKPVTGVTWFGAYEFCDFYGGFLPNEAQWENAARGNVYSDDAATPMYMYSGSNTLSDVAVYNLGTDKTPAQLFGLLGDVGSKNPNQLGIYDMSGNAEEWTRCPWARNYTDPYPLYDETSLPGNVDNLNMTIRGGRPTRGLTILFQPLSRSAYYADKRDNKNYHETTGFRFFDANID